MNRYSFGNLLLVLCLAYPHLFAQTGGQSQQSAILPGVRVVTVANAEKWPGKDVGEWIKSAWESCDNACTVFIAAGKYSQASTIKFPCSTNNGQASLWIDKGATLVYSGNSDQVSCIPSGKPPNNSGFSVFGGGTLISTSAAANVIHTSLVNGGKVSDLTIKGATVGNCILNEGSNSIDYGYLNISGCKVGIHNIGMSYSGLPYGANAIHVHGGVIHDNAYGYFDDDTRTSLAGPNYGNSVADAVIENNTTANMVINGARSLTVVAVHFETPVASRIASPVVIGGGNYTPTAVTFAGAHFSSQGATHTVAVNKVNGLTIVGGDETVDLRGHASWNLSSKAINIQVVGFQPANNLICDGDADTLCSAKSPK